MTAAASQMNGGHQCGTPLDKGDQRNEGDNEAVTDTSTSSSTSSDDGNGALIAEEGARDDNLGSQRAHTESKLERA